MGYSLAQAFSAAGYPVKLYDLFPAALDKARDMIALNQQTEVTSGKLTAEQSAAVLGTTAGAYRVRLSRARAALRRHLAGAAAEPDLREALR